MRLSRGTFVLATVVAVMSVSSLALAQGQGHGPVGPPGGTIYANDMQFRTVGTPNDLPNHGKFDTIYVLGSGLVNVADAAPGDMEFNGGRWEVRFITWETISPTQFTNAEQVHAAAMAGQITIGDVARRFECPLIRK
jgi:hypothetical protein